MSDLWLDALTESDCEAMRRTRNASMETLRTPFKLTAEMQKQFYHTVVCDRQAPHRYWAIREGPGPAGKLLRGMGGLTNIQWENGLAEISLLLIDGAAGHGVGTESVRLLLAEGFHAMGLDTICGECYECNPAVGFWRKMVARFDGTAVTLPRRKRWRGVLYDAYFFTFDDRMWTMYV